MNEQIIPGTGMRVSSIVLGTDYYGKTISEDAAYELMDVFYEHGGNLIDTAHVYSDYLPGEKHMSEKVIGRWLRKNNLRRASENALLIATKGGFPELGNMHASRISFPELRSDLEESLECLQIDQIDLYWLHRDNTAIPAGTVAEWMNSFIREGKIRQYGFSNWTAERIHEAVEYAGAHGLVPPAASQIKWSLAVTNREQIDDDTLVEMGPQDYAWYREHSFPVFAYSSQAKGFFSKIKRGNGAYILPEGKAGLRYSNDTNVRTYEKLSRISRRYGITIAQAALAWLLQAPFPVFPIVGCKTKAQLCESLEAADLGIIEEFASQECIFQD